MSQLSFIQNAYFPRHERFDIARETSRKRKKTQKREMDSYAKSIDHLIKGHNFICCENFDLEKKSKNITGFLRSEEDFGTIQLAQLI